MGKKKHRNKNKAKNASIRLEDLFIEPDEYEMNSQLDATEYDADYENDNNDSHYYDDDDKLPVDIAYLITSRILKHEKFLVVNESIWCYTDKTGAFTEMQDDSAEMLIESYYTQNEYRLAKTSLAGEIKTRICRRHDLQAKYEDFNANPHLINCKNGIINIGTESCTLLEHSPEYRFTYCINAKFLSEEIETPAFDYYCNTSLGGEKKEKKTSSTDAWLRLQ